MRPINQTPLERYPKSLNGFLSHLVNDSIFRGTNAKWIQTIILKEEGFIYLKSDLNLKSILYAHNQLGV